MAKRGDTVAWRLTLTDNGDPVDLTDASRIRLLAAIENTTVLDVDLDVRPVDGVIDYLPTPAQVATAGTRRVEVEVTWSGGVVQTFPTVGQARLELGEDIPGIQPP